MTTVRAKVHKFQRMMDMQSYDAFIASAEFENVRLLDVPEERVWLLGAQVPIQIYSPLCGKT